MEIPCWNPGRRGTNFSSISTKGCWQPLWWETCDQEATQAIIELGGRVIFLSSRCLEARFHTEAIRLEKCQGHSYPIVLLEAGVILTFFEEPHIISYLWARLGEKAFTMQWFQPPKKIWGLVKFEATETRVLRCIQLWTGSAERHVFP